MEHPDTLTAKFNIALVYDNQGNYDKAMEMYLESLEVRQRVIGMEHPDTLVTKNNIALVYDKQGIYDKAVEMYLEVLEVQQRALGREHQDTLRTKENAAFVYSKQGNYDKAVEMYLEVLEVQQRVLGMEHPSTFSTKHNIALVYSNQGKYDKAVEMYLEVLKVRKRVLGMEHPDTLSTKHNIATVYDSQGKYDEAMEMNLEVLEVQQRVLGMEHPDTLTTKHNIAFGYNHQRDYDKTVKMGLEVLDVRQRLLGMEHPNTLNTKHSIASVYKNQGNYDKALEMYLEVLEVRQRVLGMEHPSTLSTKNEIAVIYESKGNYDKAVEIFLEVLVVRQQILGMEHPDTLSTMHNIKLVYGPDNYAKTVELTKLLNERKFILALEFSRIIKETNQTHASFYNFAICLKYNLDNEGSQKVFEDLFKKLYKKRKDNLFYNEYFNSFGLINNGTKELTIEVVGGQLFLFYSNESNEVKIRNFIFTEVDEIILPITALNDTVDSLNRLKITKYSLALDNGGNYLSLSINDQEMATFKLSSCEVDENTKLPTGLQELNLRDVKIVDWKMINWSLGTLNLTQVHFLEQSQMTVSEMKIEKSSLDLFVLPHTIQKLELYDCNVIHSPKTKTSSQQQNLKQLKLYDIKMKDNDGNELIAFDISHLLPQSLDKLEINCERSQPLRVSMEPLKSILSLQLWNCHLRFCKDIILFPKELTLFNVHVIDEQKTTVKNILVNDFTNFGQMEKLKLCNMFVDLTQPLTISEVMLRNVQVDDWENAKWIVNKLSILPDHIKTGIQIVKKSSDEKSHGRASLKGGHKTEDACTNDLQLQTQLKESEKVKHTQNDDFRISLVQVLEIANVLENYNELEEDWTKILIGLRLSGKSRGHLKSLKCNFGTLIIETLESWMRENTTTATFNAFVEVIEKDAKHAQAADKLKSNKEIIRKVE